MQAINATKNINISSLRSDLTNVLNQVQYNRDGVVVNRSGKPAVAIVPLQVYEKWEEDWDRLFDLVQSAENNADNKSPDEIMDIVLEAQQAVRSEIVDQKRA